MKWDKMGGLAVLGMMCAIADLKLPLNVVGLIPFRENMPGPDAYRPGDIVTTRDGKTIEILNTDAEGRVILVDAIAYARPDLQALRHPRVLDADRRGDHGARPQARGRFSPARKNGATASSPPASARAKMSGRCRSTASFARTC